jgi:hypothetical protein
VRIVLAGLGALVLALLVANAVALWNLSRARRQAVSQQPRPTQTPGEPQEPPTIVKDQSAIPSLPSTGDATSRTETGEQGPRAPGVKEPGGERKPRSSDAAGASSSSPILVRKPGIRPEPPPAGGLRLLPLIPAEKAQGFKRIAAPPADGKKAEAIRACFRPMRCDGLVEPPKAIEDILSVRPEGKDVIVGHKMLRGLGTADILRCSLDPMEGLVVEATNDEVAKGYKASIQHLVIEVADVKGETVYQCMLTRDEPAAREPDLRLWCNSQGGCSDVNWSFTYPWPEALLVQHPKLNDGKPVSILRIGRGGFATEPGLRVEGHRDPGSGSGILLSFRGDPRDGEAGDLGLLLRLSWENARDEEGAKRVNAVLSLAGQRRSPDADARPNGSQDVPATVFGNVGAVTLLDPWGQVVSVLKPRIGRIPAQCSPAYPTEDKGTAVRFELDPCPAVLALPQPMERCLTGELRGQVFTVSHWDGKWTPLVRCKLNPQGGPLVWVIDESTVRRYPSRVDSLVIEAIDPKAGLVRQCMRRRKPVQLDVSCRPSDAGSSTSSSAQGECSFLYPWPETLSFRHPEINENKPSGLFSDSKGSIAFTRKVDPSSSTTSTSEGRASEQVVDLRVMFRIGDQKPPNTGAREVSVRAVSDTLRSRLATAAKAAKTLTDDIARLDRQIAVVERQIDAVERAGRGGSSSTSAEYRRLSSQRDSLQAQRTAKNTKLSRASQGVSLSSSEVQAFADLAKVEILDAWGLPVATLRPRLEPGSGTTVPASTGTLKRSRF